MVKQIGNIVALLSVVFILASCATEQQSATPTVEITQPPGALAASEIPDTDLSITEDLSMPQLSFADVLTVKASEDSGGYQFDVEISSPDTGCEQYADWWEVTSEEGELLYRRILLHSHVDEQPFSRSGGPVQIEANVIVYIRAHMNTSGYGGQVLKGTVQNGFKPVEVETNFGADIERIPPQPEDCAF